ncbi:hypothetical protein V1512DRAFT_262380 [Lipomyces arxii]|uniref:uncharacterized protein n=1 Tax=Lipomyces arxii TaxID=56418 RepID=UPI0034CF5B5B
MYGFIPVLLLSAIINHAVVAVPTLDYPVADQYPPVARVGEDYNFGLSKYTFTTNSGGNISYSVTGLPGWLSFDVGSLTFSGTPQDNDVGFPGITVVATDSSDGVTASLDATLAVSASTAPTVELDCGEQLQVNYTTFSSSGIAMTPGQGFGLRFSQDTFTGNVTAIYGLAAGRTPLPSWIAFDAASLTFYGTTPALSSAIAPPLYFGFVLVGSDVPNFSAAESSFSILVGHHSLSAQSVSVNVTEGSYFSKQLDVELDGVSISQTNVSSVAIDGMPDWMTFDNSSLTLSGTPSSDQDGAMVTVTVTDVYDDTVSVVVGVAVRSDGSGDSVFGATGLHNVTAMRGREFTYTIPLRGNDIESVAVNYVPSNSWLHFDSTTYVLSGLVPSNLDDVRVVVNVETQSGAQSAEFYIRSRGTVTSATTTTTSYTATRTPHSHVSHSARLTSATATSTTSASTSTSPSTAVAAASSKNNKRTIAIACGIVIPLAVLAAAAILFFCCCTGTRRRQRSESSDTQVSPGHSNISKPLPMDDDDNWPLGPTPPGKTWDPPRRLSGMSVFSPHHQTYSDLEKQHVAGFVIPYDPNDQTRPRRSRMFSGRSSIRDSLASLATVATTEIFSVRLVESSVGDLTGAAAAGGRRHSRRLGSGDGSSGSSGSATIGPYSTSSGDTPTRLRSVREEDISEDSLRLVAAPVLDEGTDESDSYSSSDTSSQQFEEVPGSRGEWRHRMNPSAGEPRLVQFRNGGQPARRAASGSMDGSQSSNESDGQVFL